MAVGIVKDSAGLDDARAGLHLAVDEGHFAPALVHAAVQQAQPRLVAPVFGELQPPGGRHLLAAHALGRGNGKINVHGVGLVHIGQQRIVAHQIAGSEVFLAAVAGNRGRHLAVIQVDLGLAQFGPGAVIGGAGGVAVFLGDGVLFIQRADAPPFALGIVELRLGLLNPGLVLIALKLEQELPLLHEIAFLIEALFNNGFHPGAHFHGARTRSLGLIFGRPGHVGHSHVVHAHRGQHTLPGILVLIAAGENQAEAQNERKGNQRSDSHALLRCKRRPGARWINLFGPGQRVRGVPEQRGQLPMWMPQRGIAVWRLHPAVLS